MGIGVSPTPTPPVNANLAMFLHAGAMRLALVRMAFRPRRSALAVEPRAFGVYLLLVAGIAAIGVSVVAGRFAWSGELLDGAGLKLGGFVLLAWVLRGYRWSGPAAALEATCLMLAISLVSPLCAVVAATAAWPIADRALAAADAALFFGFDRRSFVTGFDRWPLPFAATNWIYNSIIVQPFAVILLLVGIDDQRRLWRFVLAWIIAVAVAIGVSALVPAYGTPPYALKFMDILTGARDGSLTTLGVDAISGIITFPSFHAAGAVMLAWGWWGVPRLRVAGLVLNALMMASALIVGGHYLVDLVAGALVALAAIGLSCRLVR